MTKLTFREYIARSIEFDAMRLDHYKKIQNNIRLKEWFYEAYADDDEESIIAVFPRSYKPIICDAEREYNKGGFPQSENPYRREELKIRTSFGLYVRTKGELQIAELLYSLGMLCKEEYTTRDIEKEIIYNLNGIYQPHNLIVTAEGPNNEFDMEAVRRVTEGVLMPMLAI